MKTRKGAMAIDQLGAVALVVIIAAVVLAAVISTMLSAGGLDIVNRDLLSAAAKDFQ